MFLHFITQDGFCVLNNNGIVEWRIGSVLTKIGAPTTDRPQLIQTTALCQSDTGVHINPGGFK